MGRGDDVEVLLQRASSSILIGRRFAFLHVEERTKDSSRSSNGRLIVPDLFVS